MYQNIKEKEESNKSDLGNNSLMLLKSKKSNAIDENHDAVSIKFKDANSLLCNKLDSSNRIKNKSACRSFKYSKSTLSKLQDRSKTILKSCFFKPRTARKGSNINSCSVSSKEDNRVSQKSSMKLKPHQGPSDKTIRLLVNGVKRIDTFEAQKPILNIQKENNTIKVEMKDFEDIKPIKLSINSKKLKESKIKVTKDSYLENYISKQNEFIKKQELLENIRKYFKETKNRDKQRKINICENEECNKVFNKNTKYENKRSIKSNPHSKSRENKSMLYEIQNIKTSIVKEKCIFTNVNENCKDENDISESDNFNAIYHKPKRIRIRKINKRKTRFTSLSPINSPFSVHSITLFDAIQPPANLG